MKFLTSYPNLTVVFACFFWGTYWIPLRYLDDKNNSSVWPIALGFFILSIILIKNFKSSFYKIIIQKNYYFLMACFFAALGIGLYSESLLRGEIAKVVVLFYLAPIWGTIFAKLFLNQSFKFNRLLSILLGFIGLEIIVGFEKGIFIPSSLVEWIAIIAGMTWAFGTTCFHMAKTTSSAEKTSLTSFFVSVLFIIFCFIPGGRSIELSSSLFNSNTIYIWILLFSIFWLLPSIFLTFLSVEILDPGRVNILLAFEVVVGFVSASLLTNEYIGIREIVGGIFVISACFVDVFFSKLKTLKNN